MSASTGQTASYYWRRLQNRLLNQLTANALGIPVYAGPVEATAIGNILVQAKAQGEVDSWEELKEIIINSVEPQVYYPE